MRQTSKKGLLSRLLAPVLPKGASSRTSTLPGSQPQIPSQNRCVHVGAFSASQASPQGSVTASVVTVERPGMATSCIDLGFPRGLEDRFHFGKQLGKGGNGVVRVVVDKDGTEFACKSICKVGAVSCQPPVSMLRVVAVCLSCEVLGAMC